MNTVESRFAKPEKSAFSPVRNQLLVGLRCLRCNGSYALGDYRIDSGLGCVACLTDGLPTALSCNYQSGTRLTVDQSRSGMFRFGSRLPYRTFPSLGEGGTALVSLPQIAAAVGIARVEIKNEGQNPTGSHKDRMSPLAVARAMDAGFSKVIASSSGNAGASLSSYAARAGLQCCIIGSRDISEQWERAIKLAGADLKLVEDEKRWPLMQKMVQEDGWFPVTNFLTAPVGSNPIGIEGYKTIAYEIVEQTKDHPPAWVIVPTCRGDLLFGLWRGFVEAQEAGLIAKAPRLVAVEPGARLQLVLQGQDYRNIFAIEPNNMTSIDGATATYQSALSLQKSEGVALCVDSAQAASAQRTLAESGLHVEMSSAASLAGLFQLRQQRLLNPEDAAILVATAHGYKETSAKTIGAGTRQCN